MLYVNYLLSMLRLKMKVTVPFFSIFLSILLSYSVLAKPLDEYCVSKLTPKQAQFQKEDSRLDELVQNNFGYERPSTTATFFRDKERFSIKTNGFYLQLNKEGEEKVIQKINISLKPDDRIDYIFITENKWLFIHADYSNYIIELNNPEKSFNLENITKIPFYNDEDCNAFERWFYGGCRVNQIYHSKTLDRAIISGYYPEKDNRIGTAVEIVAGKIQTIASLDEKFVIAADVPKYNGLILRAGLNEALFYDGSKITKLKLDIPKKRFSGEYPIWEVRKVDTYRESQKKSDSRRIYITNVQFGNKDPKFVIEVKKEAEIYTKKIPFAANIDLQDISQAFLSFPDDSRKWGATSNSILFEISGKYKTVLKIPKHHYIPHQLRTIPHNREILKGKRISLDEPAIVFDVVHEKTEAFQSYYIKKVSSPTDCDVILDPESPVELPVIKLSK